MNKIKEEFKELIIIMCKKYNIQDVKGFKEEIEKLIKTEITEEFEELKIGKVNEETEKLIDEFFIKFFSLVDKYSKGFDIYERAEEELIDLNSKLEVLKVNENE